MPPPIRIDPAQPSGYGDSFADVYDQWYGGRPEGPLASKTLIELAGPGPVLELGIGTGRIATPVARAVGPHGITLTGIDASRAMLERLRAKPEGGAVPVALADMAALPFGGPARFSLVYAVWNTFFNLVTPGAQERCLAEVARLLAPAGRLVLELYVPAAIELVGAAAGPSAATSSRRVITVSRGDPATGNVHGTHVELVEEGVRLRNWRLRPLPPDALDTMAEAAGLRLVERWADWTKAPYHEHSHWHITHYSLAE